MQHEVVFGPPGTGKTSYLVKTIRVHHDEVDPSFVLFCSHTKAAAFEARSRWAATGFGGRTEIQTLHSFCFGQIRAGRAQTVDDQKLEPFLEEFGMDLSEGGEGKKYLEFISRAGALGEDPVTMYEQAYDAPGSHGHFQAFLASYKAWKSEFGYLDFNDMLLRYIETVSRGVGLTLLALDEAQDLTPLQWTVINKILRLNEGCKAVIVGDPDQSIYEYQGADAKGIEDFLIRMDAGPTILSQSYRVPVLVHDLAQKVIRRIADRIDVQYAPRPYEGHVKHYPDSGFVAGNIDVKRDSLVLYSDKFIRETVEEELQSQLVPYRVTSGMPGPLDTRAGKALKAAAKYRAAFESTSRDRIEASLHLIKAGLNDHGLSVWNSISADAVIERLLHRDLSFLKVPQVHYDYLLRVDLEQEVNVRLSTLHGSKGSEATDVHLITDQSRSAIDYGFSNPSASHRLMYVGITRAKERLFTYEGDAYNYELPR